MSDYCYCFLQLVLIVDVLCFGQFIFKFGWLSFYFFNVGCFDFGLLLFQFGVCYVDVIDVSGIKYDVVFGLVYKGILLVIVMVCELVQCGCDLLLLFNCKEVKDYGEGGQLIGVDMNGKCVLIVDDVIIVGIVICEVLGIICVVGGILVGIVVVFDCQEIVLEIDCCLVVQLVVEEVGILVIVVVLLVDLFDFVFGNLEFVGYCQLLEVYWVQYGVCLIC